MRTYSVRVELVDSICTDGCNTMVGKKGGVVKLFRYHCAAATERPLTNFHCILDQLQLTAKHIEYGEKVLKVVLKVTQLIRSHPKLHREFSASLDFENVRLYGYTSVRWLSKSRVLQQFFTLKEKIVEFIETKKINCKYLLLLKTEVFAKNLAFLTDVTEMIHDSNVSMQGKGADRCIVDLVDSLERFGAKLEFLAENIKKRDAGLFKERSQFPVNDIEAGVYYQAIARLREEFDSRFNDFYREEQGFAILRNSFVYNRYCVVDQVLKCELIELQVSTELCDAFQEMTIKSVTPFWQYLLKKGGFLRMQEIALRILSRFGSNYSCESAFSAMGALKSKGETSCPMKTWIDS